MQAFGYRAVITGALQDDLVFFIRLQAGGEGEYHVDAADTPGVAEHVFGYGNTRTCQFYAHIGGFYGHGRDHAGGEGYTNRIGGTETLSLAAVICWCIGFNYGAALQVGAFTPEIAAVNNGSCHDKKLCKKE